ncbi:MAG: ABC transporter ATP-binding protein [Christensenellales bacterium]|jgi:ABC-2 type transport system ATP-binding protein
MTVIKTHGLTKTYGKARGVDGLDLTVEAGEFFGFIGPNGAGKSTTIRLLLGLIRPTGGSAEVLGRSVAADRVAILSQVGYMPSEAAFYGDMRVRDALRFSAALRHMDCAAEAKTLCDALALDPARRIEDLSLGNRKKVAIVCALQHRPPLYILDEPTSGLDPLMQQAFFALLAQRHAQGATVFLSSHALWEIQRYCNRAAIIRQGRIVACDRVDQLAHTQAKRVTLRGVTAAPELPGVRDARPGPDSVSFLYQGALGPLLARLAELPLTDMTLAEPDLEEIFLQAYAQGGEKA